LEIKLNNNKDILEHTWVSPAETYRIETQEVAIHDPALAEAKFCEK